jgi:hypothetical protein
VDLQGKLPVFSESNGAGYAGVSSGRVPVVQKDGVDICVRKYAVVSGGQEINNFGVFLTGSETYCFYANDPGPMAFKVKTLQDGKVEALGI